MDINLSISEAPGITDWLVVAIYEATSTGQAGPLVDSQAFPTPHTSSVNLSFTNVNPVPYYVIVWQSSSTAATGTVRHHFLYDPTFIGATLRDDLFLIADDTAGFSSLGFGYTDTTLIGWKFDIERRGFGTMKPEVEYHYNDTTGTWTLLSTVDNLAPVIMPKEVFIIHFQPKITVESPIVNIANLFVDSFDITDDITLDNTYANKVGLIAGNGDHLTITLPSLADVGDFKRFTFISEGGSHILAKIACSNGGINFAGTSETELYLAQSEQLTLFKKNNAWNVFAPYGNHLSAGEIVHQYLFNAQNTVLANGQVLSRTTYARLWKYVQSLNTSQLVSDTNWTNATLNNKGYYSTGDGSTTFRVPLLTAPGFLRAVDGTTRKAGSYESATIMTHQHNTAVGAIGTFNEVSSPGIHGLYNGSAGGGNTDLTSPPVLSNGGTTSPVTGKTILSNDGNPPDTGIYLSIRF